MVPHTNCKMTGTKILNASYSKLKPLARISPSRFTSLGKCPLREIWAANGKPELLPVSPSALLGTIIHKIIEMGTQGKIHNEEEINLSWKAAVESIENEMSGNSLHRHLVPLQKHVINYEVKKKMAFNIVREFFTADSETGKIMGARKSESEIWLETKDGKIGGRIDLLIHTDKGVELFDYKTGAIAGSLDNGDTGIKEEYLQQLQLYAALYFSVKSVWPYRLVLKGLDQIEHEIPFDRSACVALLNEAGKMLEEINSLIKKGIPPENLSRASAENCRYCLFRPACNSYWENRQDTDEWPIDILGEIEEKVILGNGCFRIVVRSGVKTVVIRGLSPEKHSFLKEDVHSVMFCNLGHDSADGFFIERPLTTGFKL